jgi:hypothetical protein
MTGPLATRVVELVRALRSSGVRVGVGQTEAFAQALGLVDGLERREVYVAARATLICRFEDRALFDEAFDAWWAPTPGELAQKTPQAPRHDPRAFHTTALASFMAERARANDPEVEVPEAARAASAAELLGARDFSSLTPTERDALARAMAQLRLDVARRRTRRFVPSRQGRHIDLRRALRTMAKLGVVPALPRRAHRFKPRPLVVLADVSGSMELYARLVLQFLHGVTSRLHHTQTFAFGTRLTSITTSLRLHDVDHALREAIARIVDFGGGTRIGESLGRFNREHAGRVLRRGAVVLIISDGWDVGDVARLRAELAALKRRAYRLVWLNPLMGSARFEPLAAGVAAAQALADDCLPISNLDSLEALSRHLSTLTGRAGVRRSSLPEVV